MRSPCAVVILILLAGVVAAGQDEDPDPFGGMWTLNVEKSQLSRPLRSATMRLRVAIDESDIPLSTEKMDLERVDAQGVRERLSYTARYSGQDYHIVQTDTGESIGEEARVKMVDAQTRDYTRLRNRKPLAVTRRVLSADGKTLTATVTGPDGKVQDVEIWERR